MPIDNDNPHRVYRSGYGIAFYKGITASCEREADRAVVFVNGQYPDFNFDLPRQRSDMDKLETALARAFTEGMLEARAEIRRVLGVKEGR